MWVITIKDFKRQAYITRIWEITNKNESRKKVQGWKFENSSYEVFRKSIEKLPVNASKCQWMRIGSFSWKTADEFGQMPIRANRQKMPMSVTVGADRQFLCWASKTGNIFFLLNKIYVWDYNYYTSINYKYNWSITYIHICIFYSQIL